VSAEFEIKNQPRLGLKRTAQITYTGIRYRLFRSFMTVLVIAVAIAFLMNMLVSSVLRNRISQYTTTNIQQNRKAGTWVSHLSAAPAPLDVLHRVAQVQPGSDAWRELSNFAELRGEDMRQFQARAQAAVQAHQFFQKLDYGNRRLLVGRAEDLQILDALAAREDLSEFWKNLRSLRGLRFYTEPPEFKQMLADWPRVRDRLELIRGNYTVAVNQVAEHLEDTPVLQALAQADPETMQAIHDAGFRIPPDDERDIRAQARDIILAEQLEKTLLTQEIKQQVAGRMNLSGTEVTTDVLWNMLKSPEHAEWFPRQLQSADMAPEELTAATITRLARERGKMRSMTEAERKVGDVGTGFFGLGERMTWLLAVSLLLCAVGITNAMLMSVTERYREIATLKCLGALDGSILTIFVLEACLLGFAGAIAGAVLGALLGLLRLLLSFGGLVTLTLPLVELLLAFAVVTVVGVLLAGLASIYPSLKAARLAPMEAMRIE
jgi:putative ABC transport system permease protein